MGKLKITCEEATTICTKSQYGEATFLDKIKLNLHFIYCKICRKFSKQNNQLSEICNLAKEHNAAKEFCLNEHDKLEWKEQLKGFKNQED